ncbi:MAG: hypothetical protein R2839_09650 [Thermomicrobiales bacterium]
MVYATGDPLPDVSSYIEYAASSNAIGWTLNDNESLDCFWFNIPESSGDLSTINVFTYACPAEFDVTGKMYNDLVGACTSSIADVEFYLYPSDASEVAGLTDASGFVMFENVPSGSLNLVEVPPTGYQPAAVFCASAPMGSGETRSGARESDRRSDDRIRSRRCVLPLLLLVQRAGGHPEHGAVDQVLLP